MEGKEEVKEKKRGFLDSLSSGSWIDKLSGGWGKPKSFNPDWYKDKEEVKKEEDKGDTK